MLLQLRLAILVWASVPLVGGRIVADHPGSNSLSTESAVTTHQSQYDPKLEEPLEQQEKTNVFSTSAPVDASSPNAAAPVDPTMPTTITTSTTITPDPLTTLTTTTTTTTTPTTTTTSTTTSASSTSTTTVSTTTTTLIPPVNSLQCYNAAPELCQSRTGDCECNPDPLIPGALYCCNVTDINKAIGCAPNALNGGTWKYLHIRNVTARELVLNVSNRYIKTLLSLSITDGSIQKISSSFARFSSPVCLNVSNNNISEIESRAFRELRNMKTLDISHNNVSTVPAKLGDLHLDIRGNSGMLCKPLQEFINSGGHFIDPEATNCLTNRKFNWFDSTDSIPLNQLVLSQKVQTDCPAGCKCELDRLNFDLNNTERKIITAKVDCSNRGLIDLPESLPSDTVTLNVANNNITSLKALIGKTYHSLTRLIADDNEITSLSDLEGTDFIARFNMFSIKRNKLKTIQTYQFKTNLDLGSVMFLAGNPMTCDCNAAKNLKHWLISKKAQVPDHDQIYCDGNIHLPKLVQIQESKLCQSQHDWTDYIYYLIAIEVILLVALVCKVSYDYWVFKTAGYLPWPANKMPKLPCDCLCE